MNYLNYETAIVEKYHVHIVGWPSRITFGSPSNISTMDGIRLLRWALKDGECQWAFLTKEEQKEHERKLANARSKGVSIGRRRKERSDKGKSRKSGMGEPTKKRKTALQLPPTHKSAEFVDNDEDDDEN